MDGTILPISEAEIRVGSGRQESRPSRPRRRRRTLRHLPMLLLVVLPTLLATYYYFVVATPQYVSEARFVVRGQSGAQPGMLSGLLQSAGIGRAQDDTFAVHDFILSRDALEELGQRTDLRALFARPEADPLSRFPWPYAGETFEHLYKHYLRQVDVAYDSTTGVTKIAVKAFRPEDAKLVTTALLEASERLVNRMNDRQREHAMSDARREVALTEDRVEAVAARIAGFRNREAIIDPDRQSVAMLQGITELETRVIQANTQIAELTRSSPRSPLIPTAQRRVVALQTQIDEARAKVTGVEGSLVPKMTEFGLLTLQREFANKALASATTSLEIARVTAERQQIYIDQIVKPNEADYAAYPKRFIQVGIVFATCFGLYTIGLLLVAGAREHRSV